ncbi:MAG: DUF1289 domain-containing protein [Moraxellaceae bacterium]|nr:DUF1289 domain-containing protein [Moraxellaceae bacterium]
MQDTSLSPCIGRCRLETDDICRGCFRHISEIRGWGLMAPAERRKILALLPERQRCLSDARPGH